jgi:hypothetical protein
MDDERTHVALYTLLFSAKQNSRAEQGRAHSVFMQSALFRQDAENNRLGCVTLSSVGS